MIADEDYDEVLEAYDRAMAGNDPPDLVDCVFNRTTPQTLQPINEFIVRVKQWVLAT